MSDRDRVRIWCLRHAESEANANLPGAIDDCGLTALGRHQAIAAAQPLAADPITTIYSSTALRTRQVASLTVALGQLCDLGPGVWGTPLPHARPFLVEWNGATWHCPAWPGLSPIA